MALGWAIISTGQHPDLKIAGENAVVKGNSGKVIFTLEAEEGKEPEKVIYHVEKGKDGLWGAFVEKPGGENDDADLQKLGWDHLKHQRPGAKLMSFKLLPTTSESERKGKYRYIYANDLVKTTVTFQKNAEGTWEVTSAKLTE